MKPPRRWLFESETDEDTGEEKLMLVECTGVEDPVYIIGHESPWIGVTLDQLEQYARDEEYGPASGSALAQVLAEKRKIANEDQT